MVELLAGPVTGAAAGSEALEGVLMNPEYGTILSQQSRDVVKARSRVVKCEAPDWPIALRHCFGYALFQPGTPSHVQQDASSSNKMQTLVVMQCPPIHSFVSYTAPHKQKSSFRSAVQRGVSSKPNAAYLLV